MKRIILFVSALYSFQFGYSQLVIDSNQIYMDSIYSAIGVDTTVKYSTIQTDVYPIRYSDGLDVYLEFNKNINGIIIEIINEDFNDEIYINPSEYTAVLHLPNLNKEYGISINEKTEAEILKQENPMSISSNFNDVITLSVKMYQHMEYWTKHEKEVSMHNKLLNLKEIGIQEEILISYAQQFFHETTYTLERNNSFEEKLEILFKNSKQGQGETKAWCDCAYLTHNAVSAPGDVDQAGNITPYVDFRASSSPEFHFTNFIVEGPAHYKGLFMRDKNGGMAYETATFGVTNPDYVMSPSYVKQAYNLVCIGDPETPTCKCTKLIGIDALYSARLTAYAPDKKFFWSDGSQAAVEEFATLVVANDQLGIRVLDAGRARVRDACETTWNPEWFNNLLDVGSAVLGLVIDLKTDTTSLDSLTSYANNIQQVGQSIITLASTPFVNQTGTCTQVDKTATLVSGKQLWALQSNTPTDIVLSSYTYLGSRGYGSWDTKAISQSGYGLATVIQSQNGFDPNIKDCCTDRVGHWNASAPTNQPNSEANYRNYAASYLGLWGPWNGLNNYDAWGNPIFPQTNGGYFVYDDLNMDNCAITIPNKKEDDENIEGDIDIENFEFSLFPNPTNDFLNINCNSQNETNLDISIYNIAGQKIETIYYGNTVGLVSLQWQSKNLNFENGTYYVVISDENSVKESKAFIYQK